jgi:phosphoglycolate phosphatase-like HAD superfamily hydrolase
VATAILDIDGTLVDTNYHHSAKQDEVDVYLDLLDARDLADAWTTSADVEATKPAPDLVHAALKHVGGGGGQAVMIGDTACVHRTPLQ